MKISFVVPAYNEEAGLGRSLAAILTQVKASGCTAQVIVVNNASTDGTGAVARSFPGVEVVDEPQKGLYHARRAGLMAADGDLIANVDADTCITDGWIERVIAEFSAAPKLVALSGPYIYYDVSPALRFSVNLFYRWGYVFYALNRWVFKVGSMMQGGNFIVRSTALRQIGGYNAHFAFYGEDTDLARRLSAVGDVKFTFKLPAESSGRRLQAEGPMKIGLRYAMNFMWATFFHKPFTESWIDIRD
jgi:glycosyltransferase involved in cell wall biosynthesis